MEIEKVDITNVKDGVICKNENSYDSLNVGA